jgi:hypothetical protein
LTITSDLASPLLTLILQSLFPRRLFSPWSIYPPQTHEILSLIFKIISHHPAEALSNLEPSSLKSLRYHRLTPWLYREVAQKGWERYILSPSLLQDLRRDYMLALIIATRQSEMTLRLVQKFSERKIEVILLKGADLRHRLYGDPAARLMEDVDFLIDRQDLPEARRLLAEMGFQLPPDYLDLTPGYWEILGEAVHYSPPSEREFSLDLHWEIGALFYFYRITYAPLRKDAVPFSSDEPGVYILSPENLLIYLCLNAQKDPGIPILSQLLDLVLALSTLCINWRTVTDRARIFRCQRPVYLLLREVALFAPHLVPQEALERLAKFRPSLAELMVLHGRLRYLTLGIPSFYRHRSLRDWLKVMKATLWPEADYLTAVYERPDRRAYLRTLLGKAPFLETPDGS